MSHYDETKNRFNPCNRFIGDIENGLRYPFACYTKAESDERYAAKSVEADVSAIATAVAAKADSSTVATIQTQIVDINQRLDDLEYIPIKINSFTANQAVFEKGSSATVVLSWNISKAATMQEINDEAVTGNTHTYSNVTDEQVYRLEVSDGKSMDYTSLSISFANNIYYGAGANINDLSGLTHILSNTKERTITVNAGAGQYIIYAYPARLGNVSFWVSNFEGGFDEPVEAVVTNASGYEELYKIYKSTNANLGVTTVDIKEEV